MHRSVCIPNIVYSVGVISENFKSKSPSVDSEEKARPELLTVNMIVFISSATVGISLHMHACTSTVHSHAIFQFMQQKQRTADPHTTIHIIIITMSRYTNH